MQQGLKLKSALNIVNINKSTFYYRSTKKDDSLLIQKITEIAMRYTFYGYRRIYLTLRKQGFSVNIKKVYRLYSLLNLKKPSKVKRSNKLNITPPENLTEPKYTNNVWAMDFCFIRLSNNRGVKILTIEDLYSRKAITIYIDFSICHKKVCEILEQCFKIYGKPKIIKTDNGPEFRAKGFIAFLSRHRIQPEHIPKGSPYYNGKIERFNGAVKHECLLLYEFDTINEVYDAAGRYIEFYNTERPHFGINCKSPDEIFYLQI
jgi:putative transposase